MPQTTYGSISQRTAAWAATEMLAHAEPILVLSKFGQNKPLPKNKADNVKFRRPIPFAVTTAPLVEGVTPSSQQMQYEDVPVTIQQYGAVTEITDKVDDLSEDPVLSDASMLSGEQAAEVVEMVTYGAIKAGTNVFYDTVAHVSRATVDSKITLDRMRAVIRSLRANRGKPVTSMLSGSQDYSTKPIEGGYIAFGHTDLEADIRGLAGFTWLRDGTGPGVRAQRAASRSSDRGVGCGGGGPGRGIVAGLFGDRQVRERRDWRDGPGARSFQCLFRPGPGAFPSW